MRVSLLAFAISVAAGVPAVAGVVVKSEMTMPNAGHRTSVMYLDTDRLRMEGPHGVMIFRGDRDTAYMLTPAKKTFMRMTSDTLKETAAAADRARASPEGCAPCTSLRAVRSR